MTLLDLFSGIGGFSLAAQWADIKTIGFAEIDPYASAVLKKHWPNVPNYGDIRNVPAVECDIITGGFPCQPFSLAGKRRGKEDDRFLWPEMLRVISEAQPDWVIGENVAGIINLELDRVLSDLESIGYEVQPFVIPACAVDAKHRRDRVWIVGHAERSGRRANEQGGQAEGGIIAGGASEDVADTGGQGQQGREQHGASCQGTGTSRPVGEFCKDGEPGVRWEPEPDVGRVAHGIPNRVHRLKCLGNAIVPQVAFQILSAIKKIHSRLDIG